VSPQTRVAHLAIFLATLAWGASFVATKAALRELSPVSLIVLRFGVGVATLVALLVARGQPVLPPRAAVPALAGIACIGIFLHQLIQVSGLELTTAVRSGLQIGVIPIWTAALSAAWLGERFDVRKIGGLVLGTCGVFLLVTRGDLAATAADVGVLRGDLLVLGSTFTWAIYTVVGQPTLERLGSARTTTGVMTLGLAMFVPWFVVAGGWREWATLSATGWAAVLFLGIGCTGLGYLCWYVALERLAPSQVAAYLYFEPLVALLAGVTLLGETASWTSIAGGVLVLIGVGLVQRGPGNSTSPRTNG